MDWPSQLPDLPDNSIEFLGRIGPKSTKNTFWPLRKIFGIS